MTIALARVSRASRKIILTDLKISKAAGKIVGTAMVTTIKVGTRLVEVPEITIMTTTKTASPLSVIAKRMKTQDCTTKTGLTRKGSLVINGDTIVQTETVGNPAVKAMNLRAVKATALREDVPLGDPANVSKLKFMEAGGCACAEPEQQILKRQELHSSEKPQLLQMFNQGPVSAVLDEYLFGL